MNHITRYKSIRRLAAGALLLPGAFLPASAQLHEQINVEGKYVPDVIKADRLNVFPTALKPSLGTGALAYATNGVAASFPPQVLVLPATGWRTVRHTDSSRGYLDLGTGSHLNSTLSAGWRFLDSRDTKAGVRFQHNSVTFWKPYGEALRNKFRYDDAMGLYGSRRVDGLGTFEASAEWHVGYFDYYSPAPGETGAYAPTQTLNDVGVHLGWNAPDRPEGLLWQAALDLERFAWRSLPGREGSDSYKGARETVLNLKGSLACPWDGGSSVGLDASLGVYLPDFEAPSWLARTDGYGKADNYAVLALRPGYRFSRGLLDINLGARLDLSFNAGVPADRYSFLHVAPDVTFALQKGQAGLSLSVTGGTEANTLARLHQFDYYNMPGLVSTRPEFTPLDASLALNLGPFSGFSIGGEMRWKKTSGIMAGGLYQYWLGGAAVGGLSPLELHGLSVSGRMAYEYGSSFKAEVGATAQKQRGETGFFNGYDRPKATVSALVEGSPVGRLHLGAGADLRLKRGVWFLQPALIEEMPTRTTVTGDGYREPVMIPLDDLVTVNAFGSWSFTPRMSVWLQASNVLNRKTDRLPGQPVTGLDLTAGLSWRF